MVTLPMPYHCSHRLRPVTNAQLVHDIRHVVFDGLLAELKLDSHLAVGQALRYLSDNLFFAMGQLDLWLVTRILSDIA